MRKVDLALLIFFLSAVFILNFGFSGIGLDSWGHLGSFLTGIPLYFLMFKPIEDPESSLTTLVKGISMKALLGSSVLMGLLMCVRELEGCTKIDCSKICEY